jgi:hypothetical protein
MDYAPVLFRSGFETAFDQKTAAIFWDVTPSSPVDVYRRSDLTAFRHLTSLLGRGSAHTERNAMYIWAPSRFNPTIQFPQRSLWLTQFVSFAHTTSSDGQRMQHPYRRLIIHTCRLKNPIQGSNSGDKGAAGGEGVTSQLIIHNQGVAMRTALNSQ